MDDGFDLYLDQDPRRLVYLLNVSLQLPDNYKCRLYNEDNLIPYSEQAYESVYFKNNSFTINAYAKWYELKKKQPDISESDPTMMLLRVERQQCSQSYIKKYLPNRKVGDLLNKDYIGNMRYSLKNLIGNFWGKGRFCFEDDIEKLLNSIYVRDGLSININNYKQLRYGRLSTHKNMDKKTYDWFAKKGLIPALVDPKTYDKLGFFMFNPESLYEMIDQEFPDIKAKKQYSKFAVPRYDPVNNRFKISMTVHINYNEPGIPRGISGKTYEKCQENMFKALKEYYLVNEKNQKNNRGIVQDMSNFYTTVTSVALKKTIVTFLREKGWDIKQLK